MLRFISENIGTIVAWTALILIISSALLALVRDKKKGRTSCGCGCADCALSGSCHKAKDSFEKKEDKGKKILFLS